MKNVFIVFDGIDGCGKSTQLANIHKYLFSKDKRFRILSTREPTYGKFGKKIREFLKENKDPHEGAHEFLELFVKDRKEHTENLIKPFLEKEDDNVNIVLCDRYYYSTIAYQGAQGASVDLALKENKKFRKPDLALILTLDPESAMKRMKKRALERFETLEFMKKLANNFKNLPKHVGDNIVFVDASGSVDDTFAHIRREVDKVIG